MKRTDLLLAALTIASGMMAQNRIFDIDASKKGFAIPSTMYGIFFEDINFGADGGLYAELVMNRSFEYPNHLAGWKTSGKVSVQDDGPFDKNPHYVRLCPAGHPHKHTMIENSGYFGIGVKENEEYTFSVWARCPEGGSGKLRIDLADEYNTSGNQSLASSDLEISGGREWKKYSTQIKAPKTLDKAQLRVWLHNDVTTDLEHVSLFPVDVFRGDENGVRRDLAEKLEQMKPGIFRFPGGCIVEGTDLATRYQWKNTVGPVENRPLNENRWHYTFTHRFFPDYYQTGGLGFFELFRLSEEIGAEPLPVMHVGLSCQFQNDIKDEERVHVALNELQPYIDDCIDLIEFANGDPATNHWAKIRAEMGHPAPFGLKFMAIGNEQWDYEDNPAFTSRLKIFIEAIRKVHPEIRLIGSTGPGSEGELFDRLQPRMKELKVDLYDEHFYRNEEWFLKSANRYDKYDRSKGAPKIFAGEYACHGKKGGNHFNASLMEAAFMTCLERNADVVEMATYAPLFAHVEGWQWKPDAIWYDNLRSFGSCSYYVQQMYSLNKGTNIVKLTMNGKPVAGNDDQDALYASAAWDDDASEYIVKIINAGDKEQPVTLRFKGLKKGEHEARLITFHSDDLEAENTLENPQSIVPKTSETVVSVPSDDIKVAARTFMIYRIKSVCQK